MDDLSLTQGRPVDLLPEVDLSNVRAFNGRYAPADENSGQSFLQTMKNAAFGTHLYDAAKSVVSPAQTLDPETAPPAQTRDVGANFGAIFSAAVRQAQTHDDGFAEHNAAADATTARVAAIKAATGVSIPNPYNGGFAKEAADKLYENWKAENPEMTIFRPEQIRAQLRGQEQAMRDEMFREALKELADKYVGDSDKHRDILAAIDAGTSVADSAREFARGSVGQLDREWKRSHGVIGPYGAWIGGSVIASLRNPISVLGLAAGGGSTLAKKPALAILEAGARQAGINAAITAVQEPAIQEWHGELGEENGLVPALKDIATSALFGFVPGSVIQVVKEGFKLFRRPPAPGTGMGGYIPPEDPFDAFLRQVYGGEPPPRPTMPGEPLTRGQQWRKEMEDWWAEHGTGEPLNQMNPDGTASAAQPPRRPTAAPTEPAPASPVRPGAEPETSVITPEAITAAELDHAMSPPRLPDVAPEETLAAYHGNVLHGEHPDEIAPPVAPVTAPDVTSPGLPPDHVEAPPVDAGASMMTEGYEGPNPDALKNRIEYLKKQLESSDVPENRRRDFAERIAEFERYIGLRDRALERAGIAADQAASIRALRPNDIITGQTRDGREITGRIEGWGRRSIGVVDSQGIHEDISPATVTTIKRGGRGETYAEAKSSGRPDMLDGKPVTSNMTFDPRELGTDAKAFQYKGNSDESGVTDRLKGIEAWDDLASGKIVVYERADGKRFIVDGHQRLGLAKKLLAEGHETSIELNGTLLRESDGWTVEQARARAAKKNIQEGSGDPLDTARILRDYPEMWDKSLPVTRGALKQAKGLAELSDEAWGMMLNNVIPQNYAALVGQGMPNKTQHAAVFADIAAAKPSDENGVRMIIADANAAGFIYDTQLSIFGAEEVTRSLKAERAQVYSAVISALRDDKKVFSTLDREASRIEAAGNVLVDTNASRAERAAQLAQILTKLATRSGPVSAALNRSAQTVADGMAPAKAARAFLDDVARLVREEGLKFEEPPAGIPAAPTTPADLDTPAGREEQTKAAEAAIIAYHGTPHEFDKFDVTKIGTGEGAQSYGHMVPTQQGPKERAKVMEEAPPSTVLSKFVGECEV